MTPESRFRLNEGAKEHRLKKLRNRLEAATPSKGKPAKSHERKRKMPVIGWLIFGFGLIALLRFAANRIH
jgi:hypothetical protein